MDLKRNGIIETPNQDLAGVLSSPPTTSVFMHYKDSDFQSDRQYHPCTYCANWTRCIGYYQWKECQYRILQKEVEDE